MSDSPTLVKLLQEIDAIISERNELRKQLALLQEPTNQKKLTDREVKEIRNLARTSDLTQREIADCYAVNPATVSRIVRGVYHK
jgi:DNA-binding MarR family transcriptional regulator